MLPAEAVLGAWEATRQRIMLLLSHAGRVVRRRVIVKGCVQGVFFRDSCRREALAKGVVGWVHNRVDGAVEAALEGEAEAVDLVVAWMRSGPRHASVEAVDVREDEPMGETGFSIR